MEKRQELVSIFKKISSAINNDLDSFSDLKKPLNDIISEENRAKDEPNVFYLPITKELFETMFSGYSKNKLNYYLTELQGYDNVYVTPSGNHVRFEKE